MRTSCRPLLVLGCALALAGTWGGVSPAAAHDIAAQDAGVVADASGTTVIFDAGHQGIAGFPVSHRSTVSTRVRTVVSISRNRDLVSATPVITQRVSDTLGAGWGPATNAWDGYAATGTQ